MGKVAFNHIRMYTPTQYAHTHTHTHPHTHTPTHTPTHSYAHIYMYTYCYSARPSYGWASHVVVWGVSVLAAATLASIPKGPGKCVCVCTCMREGGGKHTKIVFFLFFFPLKRSVQGLFHKQQLKFANSDIMRIWLAVNLLVLYQLLLYQNFGNCISQCFFKCWSHSW